MAGFMPVRIVPEALPVPLAEDAVFPLPSAASASDHWAGLIEIVLATAHRLIVEGPFDAGSLARLLSVLARP